MQKGFTLIELMVSVTIFIIVMVISLGALLSISAAERKAESLKTVMNNLNFGLESMSRSIRTGVTYHCPAGGGQVDEPSDCSGGDDEFAFEAVEGNINNSSDQVVYRYGSGAAECGAGSTGGCILRSQESGAANSFFSITAPEINITNLRFYVTGTTPQYLGDSPGSQPKVVITVSGQVQLTASQTTAFNLQTSITQRLYDQ